eukprot:PhF_6_TR41604/c0_g1_i1/m.63048/K01304/pcp; pyroglutamyl-peptidase
MHATRLHLTGFGPFLNVTENPSEKVVTGLCLKNTELAECSTVMPVTAKACDEYFLKSRLDLSCDTQSSRHVFIHIGVNRRGKKFHLECQAVNIADFGPSGDASGELRNKEPIDSSRNTTGCLKTSLDCAALVQAWNNRCRELGLRIPKGNTTIDTTSTDTAVATDTVATTPNITEDDAVAIVSEDAGKYLCNYCYYRSLQMQSDMTGVVQSIFVHIPGEETCPIDIQIAIVQELINVLRC